MQADGALRGVIAELVRKSGAHGISFAEFMRLALYHEDHGYYARPRKIGRSGDFYTGVSVGPCFGMLLARKIAEIQQLLGGPADFAIIEQGAHDGQLAEDILNELPARYLIDEPNPNFREAQREKLGDRAEFWSGEPVEAGVFLCNELVDAFPVHRVRFEAGAWRELRVFLDGDEFSERSDDLDLDPELLSLLPAEAAEGFQTEICPAASRWISQLGRYFERGVFLIIDYGLTAGEFFAPERREGVLRCFREHSATDNPFEAVGQTDITTQVNFSQLEAAAAAAGLDNLGLTDQSRFLTRIAADWLREIELAGGPPSPEQAALLRQFQTLTHPGLMGRVFRALTLGKGANI